MKTLIIIFAFMCPIYPQSNLLLLMGDNSRTTGEILTDSLAAYWNMSDANDSYGTHNLTNSGVSFVSGKVGNCGDFESTQSDSMYISGANAGNLDINGNQDFTIACWYNLETASSYRSLISKNSAGNMQYLLYGYNNSGANSPILYVSGDGSTLQTAIAGASPVVSTWYFVVAWHNATTDSIYIQVNNGTVVKAAHSTGIYNGEANFVMGKLFVGIEIFYDGLLDEVGIWRRTLTADERTYLYNSGNGRTYTNGKIQ